MPTYTFSMTQRIHQRKDELSINADNLDEAMEEVSRLVEEGTMRWSDEKHELAFRGIKREGEDLVVIQHSEEGDALWEQRWEVSEHDGWDSGYDFRNHSLAGLEVFHIYDIQWSGRKKKGLPTEVLINSHYIDHDESREDAIARLAEEFGTAITDCQVRLVPA